MKLKPLLIPILAASGLLAAILIPTPSKGEVGPDDPAFAALLKDIAAQQVTITENHTKIDEKLAAIAENVRLARAFASRGR